MANKKILIDIGAHLGQTVKRFYNTIPDAKNWIIYSFEPIEYDGLVKAVCDYKNVNCIKAAASTFDGFIDFYLCEKEHAQGHTSIHGKLTNNIIYDNCIKVPAINFVKWIKEHIHESDFCIVKMNIEGGEYELMPHLPEIFHLVSGFYIKYHHHKFSKDKQSTMINIYNSFINIINSVGDIPYICEPDGPFDFAGLLKKIKHA